MRYYQFRFYSFVPMTPQRSDTIDDREIWESQEGNKHRDIHLDSRTVFWALTDLFSVAHGLTDGYEQSGYWEAPI